MINSNELRILRRDEVLMRFGMSKTWLRDRVLEGLLPPPISLGGRSVGWLKHEVDAVIAAMAVSQTDDTIKDLVRKLIEQREYQADQSMSQTL